MDQLAVFLHPMRNGDAVAEVGVCLALAAEHALDISRRDMAGVNEHLAGSPDGFFLAPGAHAEADVFGESLIMSEGLRLS